MDTDRSGADNVSVLKLDTSFGHEEARDFSLPDYMPEIKRLLYVSATALPEGKFLNGNALELDGTLSYNAVYVGEDGTLVSAPLVTEYSADTALPFSPENTEGIAVDTEIENSACRATGPRSRRKTNGTFSVCGTNGFRRCRKRVRWPASWRR